MAATKSPVPLDTKSSGPKDTKSSGPKDTKSPGPTDTKSPGPKDTKSPGPKDTKSPGPKDTKSPGPKDTKSPGPTDKNTKEVKEEKDNSESVTSVGLGEEEQEDPFPPIQRLPSPVAVCKCLRDDLSSSEKSIEIPPRKLHILSTVERTESYLRERRIPELIRFMMTKLLCDAPEKPEPHIVKLLDDCMLFRAGLGQAPVLYERQHLEAVVKSFDPGSRGYLTSGQVRRIFTTLGLPPQDPLEEKTPTEVVLNELGNVQEKELYRLLTAGTDLGVKSDTQNDAESIKTP